MTIKSADRFEDLSHAEQFLLGVALLLPVLWVAWARIAWMPGWASVDEAGQIAQLQLCREGLVMPWRQGGGGIHRHCLVAWLQIVGWSPSSLRSFGMLLFLGESAALAWVAQGLFGARAALWAVCINAFSAVTFTRMGSVLWFQLLPLEWLLVFGSMLRLQRWGSALVWGLAAGLLSFDYDGWILALPGLALLLQFQVQAKRTRWAGGLGLLLGTAFVYAVSRAWFQASADTRASETIPLHLAEAAGYFLVHLRELVFGGGRALLYLGVPFYPQVPPWAWAGSLGILPGLRRYWFWSLACLAPLAALALHAPAVEPNRCLAAWPIFCLLLGAGLAQISIRGPMFRRALIGLAFVGAAMEIGAQARGLQRLGPLFYGESWDQLAAGKALRSRGASVTLLTDLGYQSGADFRFATGIAPAQLAQGPVVAWIPWQDQVTLDRAMGRWEIFQEQAEQGPVLLLSPAPGLAEELQGVNERLAPLRPLYYAEPLNRHLQRLEELTAAPIPDPHLRTALWESRFRLSKYLGRPVADEGRLGLQLKLLRVDPLLRGAWRIAARDPEGALILAKKAALGDPRRSEAWQLEWQLLTHLSRPAEAENLRRELSGNPEKGRYRGSWLRD